MRFFEFKHIVKEMEARIQHAEDVIFWEGSAGAKRALTALSNMAKGGEKNVTIKWDGSPAVVFGRNPKGKFVFTDKSGFVAKGYDGKSQSGDDLENMLLSRGKGGDKSASYKAFAGNMKDVYDEYEKAVPKKHRGYFKGDLLYFNKPKLVDGAYIFKPNTVQYKVQADSDLGKRVGRSKTGIVVHRVVDDAGTEGPLQNADIFEGNEVLVLPPVTTQDPPQIDDAGIKNLSGIINKNGAAIDKLLDENTLRNMKVTDFPNILYTYTNRCVDDNCLTNLGKDFVQWLAGSKVSRIKQGKIIEYIRANMQGVNALWQTVSGIMKVKDDIVQQLEQQPADVKATIGDKPGGEGYVLAHPGGDMKLVNRSNFSAANRAIKREGKTMRAKEFVKETGDFDPGEIDFMQKRDVDPADADDGGIGPGFKNDTIFDQLGKILDSQGNPVERDTVVTDDDEKFKVTVPQAKTLRMMATTDKVKPAVRIEFTKAIQRSDGLAPFLAVKDPRDMINIFADKYMNA